MKSFNVICDPVHKKKSSCQYSCSLYNSDHFLFFTLSASLGHIFIPVIQVQFFMNFSLILVSLPLLGFCSPNTPVHHTLS